MTAVFILAVGIVGFIFLGLVALLLSPSYHGNLDADELLVAGGVAMAVGIFLCVALVAVWFDKDWVGR